MNQTVNTKPAIRSEEAFTAIWEVIGEINSEASVSIKGDKLFNDSPAFNATLAKYLRVPTVVFTHRHWNSLIFKAALELERTEDTEKFTTSEIEQSRYGAAITFIVMMVAIPYGRIHAMELLQERNTEWMTDAGMKDLTEAAAFKLVSPKDRGELTAESLQSIVIRKMQQPAQMMASLKLMVKNTINKELKKYLRETQENHLYNVPYDTNNEWRLHEVGEANHDTVDEDSLQFDYLKEIINYGFELLTAKEKHLYFVWQERRDEPEVFGRKTFRQQCAAVANSAGICEKTARVRADAIAKKFRKILDMKLRTKLVDHQQIKSKGHRSSLKSGRFDGSAARRSGKPPAAVCTLPFLEDRVTSRIVDGIDGEILRDFARKGHRVFAELSPNVN